MYRTHPTALRSQTQTIVKRRGRCSAERECEETSWQHLARSSESVAIQQSFPLWTFRLLIPVIGGASHDGFALRGVSASRGSCPHASIVPCASTFFLWGGSPSGCRKGLPAALSEVRSFASPQLEEQVQAEEDSRPLRKGRRGGRSEGPMPKITSAKRTAASASSMWGRCPTEGIRPSITRSIAGGRAPLDSLSVKVQAFSILRRRAACRPP